MADDLFATRLARGEMTDDLVGAVYDELRAIAGRRLQGERPSHLLQPTALVHEAYLRLVGAEDIDWHSRTHFRAVAARAIQRVIIDQARHRNREKRGGGWRRIELDDAFHLRDTPAGLDAEALHEALERMRELDERQCRIVELRVFAGLTVAEVASVLDVSVRTVERDWKMGLAWLRLALSENDG